MPAKTMGLAGWKPGRGDSHGRSPSVMWCPHARIGHFLDRGVMNPTSPGPSSATSVAKGANTPKLTDLVVRVRGPRRIFCFLPEGTVHHAHQQHHASIAVVPTIEQQHLERLGQRSLGRRNPRHHGFQDFRDATPVLAEGQDGARRVDADDFFDSAAWPLRIGPRAGRSC